LSYDVLQAQRLADLCSLGVKRKEPPAAVGAEAIITSLPI
jgi:hypothetical protein